MSEDYLWIVPLVILALIVWIAIAIPRMVELQKERERWDAAEKERVSNIRDKVRTKYRGGPPKFIRDEIREFKRNYTNRRASGMYGEPQSPLFCFGCRVGLTNGRVEEDRLANLEYAVVADLDQSLPFLSKEYRLSWGRPLSAERYNRIRRHLGSEIEKGSARENNEVAVSEWTSDLDWFCTRIGDLYLKPFRR